MPLLRSLTRAGIEAWTPVEQSTKRVPRANVKRIVDRAVLPSYIFTKAEQMPDLLAIMNSPSKDHREFRLFKHNGGIPLIADSTLDALRMFARKSTAKAIAPSLNIGDTIKLTDGSFAGLSGEIESVGKAFATVRLPGFNTPIKVANFYLLPEGENYNRMAAA